MIEIFRRSITQESFEWAKLDGDLIRYHWEGPMCPWGKRPKLDLTYTLADFKNKYPDDIDALRIAMTTPEVAR